MAGQPPAQWERNVFVPPTLPAGSEAVRDALAAVVEAVSLRSAEIYIAYRGAPARAFIDAVCRTCGACDQVAALATFLDVEVPPARSAMANWLPSSTGGSE